jgi:hypothetical protein
MDAQPSPRRSDRGEQTDADHDDGRHQDRRTPVAGRHEAPLLQ